MIPARSSDIVSAAAPWGRVRRPGTRSRILASGCPKWCRPSGQARRSNTSPASRRCTLDTDPEEQSEGPAPLHLSRNQAGKSPSLSTWNPYTMIFLRLLKSTHRGWVDAPRGEHQTRSEILFQTEVRNRPHRSPEDMSERPPASHSPICRPPKRMKAPTTNRRSLPPVPAHRVALRRLRFLFSTTRSAAEERRR